MRAGMVRGADNEGRDTGQNPHPQLDVAGNSRSGGRRVSVAIVDDSLPLQKRLAALIPQDGSAEVIAFASSVFEAVQLVWDRSPDVVVLDFQLQDGTALNVLEAIEEKVPHPAVIVLTNYPEPIYRSKCLEAGAYRFLDKSTEFDRLTETIHEIMGGRNGE
ncbi:MAG: DNA-binding response regulator [Spirochaetaceae bacterium]|nr:MAG: DNA-binding response regulator [Spirochaetaceae bacterium]